MGIVLKENELIHWHEVTASCEDHCRKIGTTSFESHVRRTDMKRRRARDTETLGDPSNNFMYAQANGPESLKGFCIENLVVGPANENCLCKKYTHRGSAAQ